MNTKPAARRQINRRPLYLLIVLALFSGMLLNDVSPALAGTPPNRLDYNGGHVLANPAIHNLYLDFDWNGNNAAAISRGAIDNFTQQLVSSSYFDSASQYGVGAASFTGSDEASILCPPPVIAGVTEFVAITLWIECMTAPGPDPIIRPVLTGIPAPDGNTVYAIYVPTGTQINDIAISSCGDFGAYHFFGGTLVWDWIFVPVPIPVLVPQDFAFTVVPMDCVNPGGSPTLDGVSNTGSHELIEAATDPIILQGWIDNSKALFNGDILKEGEAADICEAGGDVPTPSVRMTNGLLVSPYWSNADGACVPITHTIHLNETGLPSSVPHQATFDGTTVTLPFEIVVEDGTTHSFSFPTLVNDPNPNIRYVTTQPAETITVTADVFRTAIYTTQYFLTVSTEPLSAMPLDLSLTPSDWHNAGSVVNLTTDPTILLTADSRLRFDHWSGDSSSTSPSTTLLMNGPKSVTANYVTQYFLTVLTDPPAAAPLDLSLTPSDWHDEGTVANLTTDAIIPFGPGTQLRFNRWKGDASGTSTSTTILMDGPKTAIASYITQYLLTVNTIGLGANNTQVFNGATLLGTANDLNPLVLFLDEGPLALSVDAYINGANGVQYFFQDFSPPPPTTLNAPFTTVATYKTISDLIDDGLANGGLHGPGAEGLANAYRGQFEKVERAIANGDYDKALHHLKAFINHVQAQSGKHLTPEFAATLQLNAMTVYHNMLCLGIQAGQIKGKAASKAYDYYRDLVTSLGGTVLPPC